MNPPKKTFDKQYFQDYYQKNKEKKKERQIENYNRKKEQAEKEASEKASKLYSATSIKVLLTLKEYTELSPAKKKLFADFVWTFNDLNQTGFFDIIQIQKLELVAGNLRRDYYATAKDKGRVKKHWNSLTEAEQNKLIKYWSREKVRSEMELETKLAHQELKTATIEKELSAEVEIAKFHEERGKVNCSCWHCEKQKQKLAELEQQWDQEQPRQKLECPECKKLVYELDEQNDICKNCVKDLQG